MSLMPAFEIGIWNAWLFMIVFPLQWLTVAIFPERIGQRTGSPPGTGQDRRIRLINLATMALWVISSLYSIFLPLHIATAWFYVGLGAFIIGVVLLVFTTVNIYHTPSSEPFTRGAYRFSRHPGYLSMIFIYLGASIAAASWLFLLITVITFFLLRYEVWLEETYCGGKFGRAYREYMDRTPRWIGLPKSG